MNCRRCVRWYGAPTSAATDPSHTLGAGPAPHLLPVQPATQCPQQVYPVGILPTSKTPCPLVAWCLGPFERKVVVQHACCAAWRCSASALKPAVESEPGPQPMRSADARQSAARRAAVFVMSDGPHRAQVVAGNCNAAQRWFSALPSASRKAASRSEARAAAAPSRPRSICAASIKRSKRLLPRAWVSL